MYILAIETSCDDTGIAVLKDNKVISNFLYSQIKEHKKYGGVIPEIASRVHLSHINTLIERAINNAQIKYSDLDYIAFAQGPGLVNTLQIGLITAKTLSQYLEIPLIPINHIEAHLYSSYIDKDIPKDLFRKKRLGVIVSGGHTEIVEINNFKYNIISKTSDDTIGECFDKVGKMLKLGYPGGPIIDSIYDSNKTDINFKVSKLKDGKMSYSGLKSQVRREIETKKYSKEVIASSFQKAAVEQIIWNLKKVYDKKYEEVMVAGGVSANSLLRTELSKVGDNVLYPELKYCKDNAAMIGNLAYIKIFLKKENVANLNIDSFPRNKWN
ncbi:MAG: tRNA (adenosine(37)-N6)-threonylcarbamoyltransferase complex transferase subunit TsaD [Mycoplasmataceae bacterium]|nr:tRNA (adenosine(37)-N6)-threonylcarbamoyltransferase complex transferase subunit TsaD [Mycoplasmataceae bacterium]